MPSHAPSGHSRSFLALSALFLALPSPLSAFECKDVMASGVHFNFKELGGPQVVSWTQEPDYENQEQFKYNFTLDLCHKLPTGKPTDCHPGARVCALRERVDLDDQNANSTLTPIDIAGTYTTTIHRNIDAQFKLLRESKSNSDAGREGVRAELHGGRFPFEDKRKGINQRAIIEFVCDRERTGLEGANDGEKAPDDEDGDKEGDKDGEKDGDKDGDKDKDGKEEGEERKLRLRDDTGNGQCENTDASLRFCGYELDNLPKDQKVRTLRLEWRTKYACEDARDENGSSGWGFFTWFIIILFLAIASYLIFGSWLNYNRYGARGWDLIPHGDTIRDIPYILKDWARRVAHTIQGSGGRGGYSAV